MEAGSGAGCRAWRAAAGAGAEPTAAAGAVQGLAAKTAAPEPRLPPAPSAGAPGAAEGPRLSRGQARGAVGQEGPSPPREVEGGGQMAGRLTGANGGRRAGAAGLRRR